MPVAARPARLEQVGAAGTVRRVAVVGAGISGVVTARMLIAAGFAVTVFEKTSDVGGVWSASRSYPGISTQDDRRSYVFSDAALPPEAAEHPSGAEVQAYLDRYLRDHAAGVELRLSTRVLQADLVGDDDGWQVDSEGPDGRRSERFDWLIAANGVFSTPHVPDWPGVEDFERAGGRVVTPSVLADGAVLDGARAVVVGWGKTACDVATVAAGRSSTVAVVARTVMWKYPKRFPLGVTFRHLLLTRAGERLILGGYRSPSGRLLLRRLPERIPRVLLGRLIGRVIDRSADLTGLGLRPSTDVRSSNSLVSEGFFEAVAEGRIRVHRERTIARLGGDAEGPHVVLSDGARLPADVVVAATGYEQRIEFLSDPVLARAGAADGALLLHRRTLAVDVPRFALAGWSHSYRSPLTSEIAAVWLAGVLSGLVDVPTPDEQRASADRFRLTPALTVGARTGSLPGVTLLDLDRMLAELGSPLPLRLRLRQIWRPVDPADYRPALTAARQRITAMASRSGAPRR